MGSLTRSTYRALLRASTEAVQLRTSSNGCPEHSFAVATRACRPADDFLFGNSHPIENVLWCQRGVRAAASIIRPYFSCDPMVDPAIEELLSEETTGMGRGLLMLRVFHEYNADLRRLTEEGWFVPAKRPAGLKYAVGDTLKHKIFGRVVVTGWHETCKMPSWWIEDNRVRALEHGAEQPFYNALVEGDPPVGRYLSQENLSPDETKPDETKTPLEHGLVAHYFHGFDPVQGRHVPVPQLAALFPEDAALGASHGDHAHLDSADDAGDDTDGGDASKQ